MQNLLAFQSLKKEVKMKMCTKSCYFFL